MKLYNLVYFLANNPCEDPDFLRIILYIRKLANFIFTIVPLVLIVLITFDFVKSVTSGNEDGMRKNNKIVIKRLIYAVLLFFVMPIVNIVFSAFGTSGQSYLVEANGTSYLSCWDNAESVEKIDKFKIVATFDGNGGTVQGGDEIENSDKKSKSCGGSVSCKIVAPLATKSGSTFFGWSNNNCKNAEKGSLTIYNNGNNAFKACWDTNSSSSSSGSSYPFTPAVKASKFWWPIAKKHKDLAYLNPNRKYKPDHKGIDITSSSGKKGEIDVIAAYDGTVVYAFNDVSSKYDDMYGKSGATSSKLHDGYGNFVMIEHVYNGKYIYSYYAHLTQDVKVRPGDKVTVGQVIGKMGSSGNSSGTHLHFEIRVGKDRVRAYSHENNPLEYVKEKEYPTLN